MLDLLKQNKYSLYCRLGKVHFREPVTKKTDQEETDQPPEKDAVKPVSQVSSDPESQKSSDHVIFPLLRDIVDDKTESSVTEQGPLTEASHTAKS
ncbi:hypothetical protein JTE90_023113 [Oedothorax gibbosus]|uniref:Uncharacterized protein n=1 Tax=Oedothorax gibbosus TaxID=931172 RepID=A0AAV6UMA2_9ARAC|nr:hypothetical protein JTE90_023113 [Oedothorax gibbosus]